MRKFGLIGYPLSHSFSKKYFTEKFERENIPATLFENFSIPAIEDLEDVLLNNPGLEGFCITIPYKKAILQYLDETSDAVKQIGACNCVRIHQGRLSGYNTDVAGFEHSFIQHLLPHHKKALILGTGGAAMAVEFVLQKLGIPYQYISRKQTDNSISYGQINADLLEEYSVIINCTPLGTYPKAEEAPDLPYTLLSSNHYLFDLVYNPPLTRFLQQGAAYGAIIQNGYDMLIGQAEAAWNIWNE